MKKIVLFVAVISAFSFASCKKDHTCTCTSSGVTTSTDPNYVAPTTNYTQTDVVVAKASKKGDAKKACIGSTQSNVQTYGTYTYTTVTTKTCDLK